MAHGVDYFAARNERFVNLPLSSSLSIIQQIVRNRRNFSSPACAARHQRDIPAQESLLIIKQKHFHCQHEPMFKSRNFYRHSNSRSFANTTGNSNTVLQINSNLFIVQQMI